MKSLKIQRITKIAVVMTLLFVLLLFPAQSASAAGQELVDVNIIFNDNVDDAFLQSIGANVRHTYQTFPGISISLPSAALTFLDHHPHIASWELEFDLKVLQDGIDWGVDRIDSEKVWGGIENAVDITTGVSGSGVKVAIIDTGIDYNHEDLAANYAGGYDFYNNDADPMDDHSHGSHVAGTIAAIDNDITGSLVGVAPNAQLYAVKVCSGGGSCPSSAIASGLDWAAANGMDIASLSLGGGYSSIVDTAGQNAYAMGVLLVAASGNDYGQPVGYPAANEEFIAVGATTSSDALASYSNRGANQELAAPGSSIGSTVLNNQYGIKSGTSMATPHVSGVAALVKSANPTLTNVQIRDILQQTSEDLGSAGWDSSFGYGLVDAEAAVNAAGSSGDTTPPGQVTGLAVAAISTSQLDLSWNANTESDLKDYKIFRDGIFIARATSTTFSDTGLLGGTTYTYEVSAVDTSLNEGIRSASASATTQEGVGDTMYVQSITFIEQFEGWWIFGNYYTYGTVTVVDGNGLALSGVRVDVTVTFADGSTSTTSALTDANGEATFRWTSNTCGNYNLAVNGLTLTGSTWDTSQGITSNVYSNC